MRNLSGVRWLTSPVHWADAGLRELVHCTHSLNEVRSLTLSLTHSLTDRRPAHCHSLTHSPTHSLTLTVSQLVGRSLPLIHSPALTFTQSRTHSLTQLPHSQSLPFLFVDLVSVASLCCSFVRSWSFGRSVIWSVGRSVCLSVFDRLGRHSLSVLHLSVLLLKVDLCATHWLHCVWFGSADEC